MVDGGGNTGIVCCAVGLPGSLISRSPFREKKLLGRQGRSRERTGMKPVYFVVVVEGLLEPSHLG